MSYTDDDMAAITTSMDKHRGGEDGEIGAALVVVGLSAESAAREKQFRDDMILVAHRCGASIRQLAETARLDRKTITALVSPKE